MPNGLDPDRDRRSVGLDLGPNSLQRLSEDDIVAASKEVVKNSIHRHLVFIKISNTFKLVQFIGFKVFMFLIDQFPYLIMKWANTSN